MKHLKKKLAVATAMLLVSATMLSSVSYAWFTLSTNPEITKMEANVTANENLEIALDNNYEDETAVDTASVFEEAAQGSKTGDPYTWGNLVNLETAFADANGAITLQPVKYAMGGSTPGMDIYTDYAEFSYPLYGTDGRVESLEKLLSKVVNDKTTTGFSAEGGVQFYGVPTGTTGNEVAGAPYYAFSATYWVRSNKAGAVTLQTQGVKRANDEVTTSTSGTTVNTAMGAGSYIEIPNFGTVTNGVLTENQAAIVAYLSNLKIKFVTEATAQTEVTAVIETDVYDATTNPNGYQISNGTAKFFLTGTVNGSNESTPIVNLTANVAQKVSMYVFIDGETMTNKDALLTDINDVKFNIQFQHQNINATNAGSGAMTGDDTAITTD